MNLQHHGIYLLYNCYDEYLSTTHLLLINIFFIDNMLKILISILFYHYFLALNYILIKLQEMQHSLHFCNYKSYTKFCECAITSSLSMVTCWSCTIVLDFCLQRKIFLTLPAYLDGINSQMVQKRVLFFITTSVDCFYIITHLIQI